MLWLIWHSMGTLALAAFFDAPAWPLAAFFPRAVQLALCFEVRPGLRFSEAVAVAAAAAVEVAAALVAAAGSVAGVAVLEVALVATERGCSRRSSNISSSSSGPKLNGRDLIRHSLRWCWRGYLAWRCVNSELFF